MKNLFLFFALLIGSITISAQSTASSSAPLNDGAPTWQSKTINVEASRQYQQAHNTGSLKDFAKLHPLIVHFPIVLIILAFVTQIVSFFVFKYELSWVAMVMIVLGFIGAVLAATEFHGGDPDLSQLSEIARATFEKHDHFATLTEWFSGIAALAKVISHFWLKRNWWSSLITVLLMLGAVICIHTTGDMGARLVHIDAIGVQGNRVEPGEMGD